MSDPLFFQKLEWEEIHPTLGTRCLLWAGYRRDKNAEYGTYNRVLAHRWLYERWFGPIEDGLELHHECEVKACVNPHHLRPSTRTEHRREHLSSLCKNGHAFDSSAGGQRTCRQCRNEANRRYKDKLRGTTPKQRRLTEAEVIDMRQRYSAGERVMDLAASFDVTRVTVQRVVHRKIHTNV